MDGTAAAIIEPTIQGPSIPEPSKRNPNFRKPRWFESTKITEKYNAFQLLRDQGIAPSKAAEMLGYSPRTGETIEKRIVALQREKAASGASVGFLTGKRITAASRVVDKFMAGKTFGDIKEIKDSTVLRAAECVLDRSHPKRSDSDTGPSLSFVTINLGSMALPGASDPAPVDVTPGPGNGPSNPQSAVFDGDGI